MMDYRMWRQRHEELLRKAALSRRAKVLRETRKRDALLLASLAPEAPKNVNELVGTGDLRPRKGRRSSSPRTSVGREVRLITFNTKITHLGDPLPHPRGVGCPS
jgi:hypothetical protein